MLMVFSERKFVDRIYSGVKPHTIRKDKHKRWKVGMTAHMWFNSPRNKSKNPYQFANAVVSRILQIKISKANKTVSMDEDGITGHYADPIALADIARHDGFDSADEFFDWFGEFEGRLIFWKDLKRVDK